MATFESRVHALRIELHPNADRLELAVVGGFRCVVGKGAFADGDLAACIREGAVCPKWLSDQLLNLASPVVAPPHASITTKQPGTAPAKQRTSPSGYERVSCAAPECAACGPVQLKASLRNIEADDANVVRGRSPSTIDKHEPVTARRLFTQVPPHSGGQPSFACLHRRDVRSRETDPGRWTHRRREARLSPDPYPARGGDVLAVVQCAVPSP